MLDQLSIVRYRGAFGLVVESDLLPKDRWVVVVPLIEGLPCVGDLNPIIPAAGVDRVLHTHAIASVRRDALEETSENTHENHNIIIRCV